ncbi:MAG TPA: hypothetical protein VN455_06110 [Methanotrichaceae archaeon]|nr:hypothetical protein [Methanotrichaceae archaeon]
MPMHAPPGRRFVFTGSGRSDEGRPAEDGKPADVYGGGLCRVHAPRPSRISFCIFDLATLALLMGATAPSPLYGLYRR